MRRARSRRRCRPFAVSYRGVPVDEWSLPKGKISYSIHYEEVLARRWHGETLAGWQALTPAQQAYQMAAYRSAQLLEAVQADEHNRAVKAAQARRRRK